MALMAGAMMPTIEPQRTKRGSKTPQYPTQVRKAINKRRKANKNARKQRH